MKKPARLTAGMLAASGLLLTACASDPTLDEDWPEIRQKVVDAQSVRLTMDSIVLGAEGGDASASPAMQPQSADTDLAGATDDSHLQGTMTVDMGDTSLDIDLLRFGQDVFLKVKPDGEDVPPQMDMLSAIVGDRWMKTTIDDAELDLSLGQTMSDLEEDMPAADAFDGKDLKAEEVELDGRKYLKYALPEEHHDFGRTMLIDPETDTLYRLEGLNQEEDVDANATFTEWNAVQAPERPADDQVVDMAELDKLAG